MIKIAKRSKRFISLLVLSVMILSMGIPVAYAQSTPVSDIASHWAKTEISAWIEQGFITGYLDGTFKPDNSITRAEFIALVNRRFALTEKGPVSFTDVKESDWFHAEFAKASKAGYLSGYQGTVGPNGFITRQEVASIAAKVKSLQEDAAGANGFADAASIPALYKGAIGAVTKAKIMNGYPDGKFEPAKGITRAESVITLNRLMSLKDSVKIEAIKDKTTTVNAAVIAAIKMTPADAKVTIQNSDSSIVQATLSGANIQLKGLKIGTATITVTGKKDGLLDSVITFKVEVGAKVSSGGGGGGSSHHSGDSNPPTPPGPVEDDTKLTSVQAVGTTATEVSGVYAAGVTRIEVIYGSITKNAVLKSDKTFSWNIYPGLANGTSVTVKGYAGSVWVDTDVVTVGVAVERPFLSDVTAVGTTATAVTGKYAPTVTKVEVQYKGLTKTAELFLDGTFSWSIFPGLTGGSTVTVKAYVGAQEVKTVTVVTAGEPVEGPFITNVTAIGTTATSVTGDYAPTVTKVEVLYNGLTKSAELFTDGTFSWSIFPGLAAGTTVTVKAYVGAQLVETKVVATQGGAVEGPFISDVTAIGTTATSVTGDYAPTVTKVEVLYNNLTKTAELFTDGTFSWSIFPGLAKGTPVTVKAYVGEVLKETVAVNVQ